VNEDEREEDFVEQTDYTTATNNYRVGRQHEAFNDEIPFKANELRKYISIGNYVNILNGRFKGETGAVVAIDETKDAMSIRTPNLQICKETATCIDSSGEFHLRDLVNISSNKVGVVVRTEKEYLQLLNTDGKNRQGCIKYFFIVNVFLYAFVRTSTENAGVFVTKSRNLWLAGGRSKFSSSLHFNRPAPFDREMSNSTEETQQPFSTLNNTNLIGETARISHGSFKGYIGNVKDSASTTRKVEPHAKRQSITVNRMVWV
ncbi:unnamed protein product, partial [Rotaria magnacalcarata]